MSYDPHQEKEKVYEALSKAYLEGNQLKKEEIFEKAISIALDELKEFTIKFDEFFKSVSHLVVFEDLMKDLLVKGAKQYISDAKYLIEKNYTTEELDAMPEEIYSKVLRTQRSRRDLLQKISKKYIK